MLRQLTRNRFDCILVDLGVSNQSDDSVNFSVAGNHPFERRKHGGTIENLKGLNNISMFGQ
ncbi:hypothetical protein D9M71_682650 [compost metagenome]